MPRSARGVTGSMPEAPRTNGGVATNGRSRQPTAMLRTLDRRTRLIVLLLLVALLSGVASVASAAPVLPSCQIADTLTKHRTLADWHRSLLDPTYRLSSTYKPADLRSTSYAGLNGGFSVRRHVVADLKAMATAARAAGARLSVQGVQDGAQARRRAGSGHKNTLAT